MEPTMVYTVDHRKDKFNTYYLIKQPIMSFWKQLWSSQNMTKIIGAFFPMREKPSSSMSTAKNSPIGRSSTAQRDKKPGRYSARSPPSDHVQSVG